MSLWLYTYNAELWNWNDFDKVVADSLTGIGYFEPWRSLIKKANKGDKVYVIKLGKEPRGIFACGIIASESYIADVTNEHIDFGKNYVDLELKEIIDWRTCPFIDLRELKKLFPEQEWSPRSSGISIKDKYCKELNSLWDKTFKQYIKDNVKLYKSKLNDIDFDADYVDEKKWENPRNEIFNEADVAQVSYFPSTKIESAISSGKRYYVRDKKNKIIAKNIAKYKCEYDNKHETFISRIDGLNYVEPHHLVPLAFQEKFEYSLDVPANIVCLCSNCHNNIHYGIHNEDLIIKLYNDRKDKLVQSGINVNLPQLLSMYNI